MPESYTREQLETALFEEGYSILQETGGLVIYQNNTYPGNELVFDWFRGNCEWDDIARELAENGIRPQTVYDRLPHLA